MVANVGRLKTATHAPAANTQAVASVAAAGAALVNHCIGILASFSAAATAGAGTLNLRDGATGAGTVLASWDLAAAINSAQQMNITEIDIPGTVNTAMTLEFAAAGGATTLEKVTLLVYQTDSTVAFIN